MARYEKTKKSKKNKKSYYATTIYSKVPENNNDIYLISQAGDRCDNLAFRFYNNSKLWWFVARVNNLRTNNIPAGVSLRIPATIDKAEGF